MSKKGAYSRGVNYLVVLAFLILLAAIMVIANTTGSTGKVTKDVQKVGSDLSFEGGCCSGYCKVSYTFGTNTKAQTNECAFSSKRAPQCYCNLQKVPKDAKMLGNPTCTVQYSDCKR